MRKNSNPQGFIEDSWENGEWGMGNGICIIYVGIIAIAIPAATAIAIPTAIPWGRRGRVRNISTPLFALGRGEVGSRYLTFPINNQSSGPPSVIIASSGEIVGEDRNIP